MFANSLIVFKSVKYIANIIDQHNSAFFYVRYLFKVVLGYLIDGHLICFFSQAFGKYVI